MPTDSPFHVLEQEAYHAFREWPIWLVLRLRELEARLTPAELPAPAMEVEPS
jgi:hypothetical protein